MKRKTPERLICCIVSICLVSSLLSGCWSIVEIDDLAIIPLIGIDLNEDNEYILSALITKPNNESFKGGKAADTMVVTATGGSLFGAMRKLQSLLAKRAFWAHTNVVIVGEKLAQGQLIKAIDVLSRQQQFRKQMDVLVTKEEVSHLLKMEPFAEGNLGVEIAGLIDNNKRIAVTKVLDLNELLISISNVTKDFITGEISYASDFGIESVTNNNKKPRLSIHSSAVFKRGKLIGWLNDREGRGVMWVKGEVKGGNVSLGCPGSESGNVTLEYTYANSELIPTFEGDTPRMQVKINVFADIAEITCPDFEISSQSIDQLNIELKKKVESDILLAFAKAKNNWQCNIFGFAEAIHRKYPQRWKQMESRWDQGVMRDMQVDLDIQTSIQRNGLITDPLEINENNIQETKP